MHELQNDFFDINDHKESFKKEFQLFYSECSKKGDYKLLYINKLEHFCCEDMIKFSETIYENAITKIINENVQITIHKIVDSIKECAEILFNEYSNSLGKSSMIRLELNDQDLLEFSKKIENQLETQCKKISAKYNIFLKQEKYNKKILSVAFSSRRAAWGACLIAFIMPIIMNQSILNHVVKILKLIF